VSGRSELVDKDHPRLSIRTQCELLGVSRSSLAYRPVPVSDGELRQMRVMDELRWTPKFLPVVKQ
jgi:putative transposase